MCTGNLYEPNRLFQPWAAFLGPFTYSCRNNGREVTVGFKRFGPVSHPFTPYLSLFHMLFSACAGRAINVSHSDILNFFSENGQSQLQIHNTIFT